MVVSYDFLPKCEPVPGSNNKCMLHEDWYFTIDGKRFWIMAGYVFDGASIPRIFWTLVGSPFQPNFWAAALAHDWLYLTHLESRSVADEVIYQLLLKSEVSRAKSRLIWLSVRSGAWWAWWNTTEDLEEIQKLKQIAAERPEHDGWKFGFGMPPVGAS